MYASWELSESLYESSLHIFATSSPILTSSLIVSSNRKKNLITFITSLGSWGPSCCFLDFCGIRPPQSWLVCVYSQIWLLGLSFSRLLVHFKRILRPCSPYSPGSCRQSLVLSCTGASGRQNLHHGSHEAAALTTSWTSSFWKLELPPLLSSVDVVDVPSRWMGGRPGSAIVLPVHHSTSGAANGLVRWMSRSHGDVGPVRPLT